MNAERVTRVCLILMACMLAAIIILGWQATH